MSPKTISDDFRLLLQDSILEILGQKDLQEVRRVADQKHATRADKAHQASVSIFSAEISWLLQAFEDKYGHPSGLGLGFRIGRVLFTRILRAQGAGMGLDGNEFRLLPLPKKIRTGLKTFSEWMQTQSDQIIQVEFQGERILWRVHPCLDCRERKSNQPICFMTAGFLQEAMYWLSGGKFYKIQESECEACGQSQCSFEIRLNPTF